MQRQAYLAAEHGPFRWHDKPAARLRAALVFPNVYRLGMSNLGFQLVWRAAHEHPDTAAERVFLPDPDQAVTPVSLETGRALRDFDVLAFSLSYEQDYLNVLRILEGGRLPRRAADRGGGHPLLVAGGPALWGNPEPVAPFFDAIVVGEGEEAISRILDAVAEHRGGGREALLEALARLEGLYVPSRYEPTYSPEGRFAALVPRGAASPGVRRLWVRDLDRHPAESAVLTPHTEFADTYLIEIARGCSRACRFCMAGFATRPVRYRQLPELLRQVDRGLAHSPRLGLLSASVSDHPDLMALGDHLLGRDVRLYMSSVRADAITPELVRLLRHGGLKSLTVAPEAGSERLRARVNKHLTHDELLCAVRLAGEGGMTGVKCYFMVGLPGENDEDVAAIGALMADLVKAGRPLGIRQFVVDLHPFVPKAFTPFQREPQAPVARLEQILAELRRPLARLGVQARGDSPGWAIVQAALARGDRRTAALLESALTEGGNLSAFRRAIRDLALPQSFEAGAPLPWDHIESGMKAKFLAAEALRAERGLQSAPCPIAAPLPLVEVDCRRCGVCGALGPAPAAERVRMARSGV